MNRLIVLVAVAVVLASCSRTVKDDSVLLKHALELHAKMVSIDTHTDTPLNFLRAGFDFSGENNNAIMSKVDLKRMEAGKLDAAFFAVFIGQRECTPQKYAEVNRQALDIFKAIDDVISKYPARAAIAKNPDDAYRIKAEGKRAIYIGVENGYPIGEDLSQLKLFYDLGARYVTLCHTRNNQICDSSTDPDGYIHNGLSDFGKQVVATMNVLGMLIDVSHISDKSFYDVLELSKAPVFASHSCARAICNNPRNLDDSMLQAIAKKGGVVQMCILSDYVKETPRNPERDSAFRALRVKYNNFRDLTSEQDEQATAEWYELEHKYPRELATVSDAVNHIDHMVKVMGINHVGIGTDFDGGGGISGCEDVSQMYNITVELLRRGYSDSDIKKIWGENFLRVFRAAQSCVRRK